MLNLSAYLFQNIISKEVLLSMLSMYQKQKQNPIVIWKIQ